MEDKYPTSSKDFLLDREIENYDQEVSSVKDHGAKDADATQVSADVSTLHVICDVIAGAWGNKFFMPYPR